MTIRECRDKRGRLLEQAQQLLDDSDREVRQMTSDEVATFDDLHAEADRLLAMQTRLEAQEVRTQQQVEVEERERQSSRRQTQSQMNAGDREALETRTFDRWLRFGMGGLNHEERGIASQRLSLLDSDALAQLPAEVRALGTGTGGSPFAGYNVPEGFIPKVVEALLRYSGVRRSRATILNTGTGNNLPMPTDDDTAVKGEIIAENAQHNAADVVFGQVIFGAHTYSSKVVLVSIQLLQDEGVDLEAHLSRKMGQRIGRIQNDHFTTGTGSGQPQGIVVGATDSAINISIGGGNIDHDLLIDIEHSLDADYRENAEWMFHDEQLKAIKKLKDTAGQPIWQSGVAEGAKPEILGHPYIINNSMADGLTAADKSFVFGDMELYWIRDVKQIQILRLVERYADFLQVGFLAFMRTDAKVVDAGTGPIVWAEHVA